MFCQIHILLSTAGEIEQSAPGCYFCVTQMGLDHADFEDFIVDDDDELDDDELSTASSPPGTPCRLVGRFAPVQGGFSVDSNAVTFYSTRGLRQLSVHLAIPTRSILNCTTEGCTVSLAVQGMAGRGVSFEFNSSAQCCQAALSLATAGQMSEEELDMGTEEDARLEGGCSAVLDEVVLSSRFNFALTNGCRLLAWERCACIPGAHCSPASSHDVANTPDTHTQQTAHRTRECAVTGILYVCEGGLIFLPDRYCKCSGEASLRAVATFLPKQKCHGVRQILGGVEVRGCWRGRHPCAQSVSGWAGGDTGKPRAATRHDAVSPLCFHLGLSKDFEALSHAAHALLKGNEMTLLEEQQKHKGNEAQRARAKVWAKTYAQHTGHQLRTDPAVRAAILGSPDGGDGGALPAGIPPACRAMVWMKLSGASEMAALAAPAYAYSLLNHPGGADDEMDALMAKAEVEINKDINRTFADSEIRECLGALGLERQMGLEWFAPKLKRILLAYARHHPAIGYCQSLNYLAGLIAIVVEADEDCFWLLTALLQVAVCCSVLQRSAVWCSVVLRGAMCCSVLQCVAVCCGVLQCCSVLQRLSVCCSVLQCFAKCCSGVDTQCL